MTEVTTADLLARLEAMAARLDEQAATIVAQGEEITRLSSSVPSSGAVETVGVPERTTTRRGLLMAAVAAVAAGTLHQSRVEVAHAAPIAGDSSNSPTPGVTGTHNGGPLYAGWGVLGQSTGSIEGSAGVRGSQSASSGQVYGVEGEANSTTVNASGVKGTAKGTSGSTNGVWGTNASTSGAATGVYGNATASSGGAVGVWGRSNGSNAGAKGVYGEIDNFDGTGTGVYGLSRKGIGVQGVSTNSFGVFGSSDTSFGCGGASSAPGTAGLFGYSSTVSAVAMQGIHTVAGGIAGFFTGDVYITGSLTVASGAKSAAVKKRDGTMARVYCQESPEPWFEDFGTAEVKGGLATVALDPEFDQVVKGDDYRVFLTEIGDCGGLYVSRKGPHRFEVKSRAGAAANGSFDYRVVARRAEAVGGRLEKVTPPKMAPIDIEQLTRRDQDAPSRSREERGAGTRPKP